MKIRIVNSREEISKLNPKERVVHVSFPLTTSALLELAKKCPKLQGIQVPPSRLAKMWDRSLILLEVLGVRIFEGSIQGYRTDRAEYITFDDELILQRAGEFRAEGMNAEEIVAKVAEEAKVSPGLVRFILGRQHQNRFRKLERSIVAYGDVRETDVVVEIIFK